MALGIHPHQPAMDVLQRPVGLVAKGVEDIEMRDVGGQPHGQGAAVFGLFCRKWCTQNAQKPCHHAQEDAHPYDGRYPCLLSTVHLLSPLVALSSHGALSRMSS